MRSTALRTAWVAALVAAMFVAGCGGEDEPESTSATPTATTTPSPGTAAAQETATPTGEATPAPADEGQEIVSAQSSADGLPFRFVITDLKRSGDTVELGARMELLSDDEDDSLRIGSTFDDGQRNKLVNADDDAETPAVFDGVALIDPVGRKKYLVARDETGHCVCSTDLYDVFLYREGPINLQATLTAPPPDITAVNVYVPTVKTFTDVPISG
jgi:hypothetical protein